MKSCISLSCSKKINTKIQQGQFLITEVGYISKGNYKTLTYVIVWLGVIGVNQLVTHIQENSFIHNSPTEKNLKTIRKF